MQEELLQNPYERDEHVSGERTLAELVRDGLAAIGEEMPEASAAGEAGPPLSWEEMQRLHSEMVLAAASDDPYNAFLVAYAALREGKDSRVIRLRDAAVALLSRAGGSKDAAKAHRDLRRKYAGHRVAVYGTLRSLGGISSQDAAEGLAAEAVEHALALAGIREAYRYAEADISRLLTGVAAYNDRDGGFFYGDAVAAFAYIRDAWVTCPRCGTLVVTRPADFGRMFHAHGPDFVLRLHGKLVQDCPECDWIHFYDIDAATWLPAGRNLILSENPLGDVKALGDERVRIPNTLDPGEMPIVQHALMRLASVPSLGEFVRRAEDEAGISDLVPAEGPSGNYELSSDVYEFKTGTGTITEGIEVVRTLVGGYIPITVFRRNSSPAA